MTDNKEDIHNYCNTCNKKFSAKARIYRQDHEHLPNFASFDAATGNLIQECCYRCSLVRTLQNFDLVGMLPIIKYQVDDDAHVAHRTFPDTVDKYSDSVYEEYRAKIAADRPDAA